MIALLLLIFPCLFAETIPSFYGPIEVEEPVLLELIESPPMQRLKKIHQYGVGYYTTHREEYTRFDHSIGVFAILRKNGASIEEQISGLIHDVSHTVFSHVGDWIFGRENQEDDYQNQTFAQYLAHSGIEAILAKYGLSAKDVDPKQAQFQMLEQPLPNLCADRIDYNIQGAFFREFLSKGEALALFEDFRFSEGRWIAERRDLLKKMSRYSYFMTEDCWGGAVNYVTSRWLADAILRALDIGLLSWEEIHFGVDQEVWEKLLGSTDGAIQERMGRLFHPNDYFQWVDPSEASLLIRFRCRGIDPWLMHNGEIVRLTSIDSEVKDEFEGLLQKATAGWSIRLF